MTAIRTYHWGWALGGAFALHGAVAVALLWQPVAPGARQAGIGGVEVSLGPAGGSPGAAAIDAHAPETSAEALSPTPTTPVTPAELPATEAEAVAPVPPVPLVDEVIALRETAPPEPARPRPALPLPPRAKPIPPEVVPTVVPPLAKTEPAAEPAPRTLAKTTPAAETPVASGTGGKAGTGPALRAGNGDASIDGGIAGSAADYMAILQAWLARHKEYPHSARRRRMEGTVMLHFVIDGGGNVDGIRIERSSGHRLLDDEAMAMIRRARPLPPVPETLRRDRLAVVVPVQFFLR